MAHQHTYWFVIIVYITYATHFDSLIFDSIYTLCQYVVSWLLIQSLSFMAICCWISPTILHVFPKNHLIIPSNFGMIEIKRISNQIILVTDLLTENEGENTFKKHIKICCDDGNCSSNQHENNSDCTQNREVNLLSGRRDMTKW